MKLTENAKQRIKELLDKSKNDTLGIRIGITGGGCSGFNYTFSFAEKVEDDDIIINDYGAIVVVDSISYGYLQGSTLDYIKDITGERFAIDNPNATARCGCGTSFSI